MSEPPITDQQLDQLYEQLDRDLPPPDLDAEIKAHARQPVAPVIPLRKTSPLRRWAIPLSTAAVMVLGLSLFFRVYEQQPAQTSVPAPTLPATQEAQPMQHEAAGVATREARKTAKKMLAQPAPARPSPRRATEQEAAGPAQAPVLQALSRAAEPRPEIPEAEQLIRRMESLLQQQQLESLEKAYTDFRKKYPHYPLSPRLQEWYKRQHQPVQHPAPARPSE